MASPSLLVTNAHVVTMDPERRILSPGYVAVEEDRIVGVGPAAECPEPGAARVIDAYMAAVEAREPDVRHAPGGVEDLGHALAGIEAIMRRHNGAADGRIQVWPSPGVAILCSREGLLSARDLARRFGTMCTLHLAESPHDRMQAGMSS